MKVNKKLILRALIEPGFRKMLRENPQEALNMAEIKGGQLEIDLMLNVLCGIDEQINIVADKLLCVNLLDPFPVNGNNPPCGI
jgi:hypothetical protein